MSIRDGILKADVPWEVRLFNGPHCQTCMTPYINSHRCSPSQLRSRAAQLRAEAEQLEARASREDPVKEHT